MCSHGICRTSPPISNASLHTAQWMSSAFAVCFVNLSTGKASTADLDAGADPYLPPSPSANCCMRASKCRSCAFSPLSRKISLTSSTLVELRPSPSSSKPLLLDSKPCRAPGETMVCISSSVLSRKCKLRSRSLCTEGGDNSAMNSKIWKTRGRSWARVGRCKRRRNA